MAEPPDLQDLAKRYLDLWQDQLRAMAADPETMASFARMLAAAPGGKPAADSDGGAASPFAWWPMAAALPTPTPMGGATLFDSVFAAGRAATEAGAEAPAASPDGRSDELRELERRLAALEARIAALEPGVGKRSRGGKGKSRESKG